MTGTTVPPGYVPRGERLAEITRAISSARGLEQERRIRRLVTIGGGWAMAGMMSLIATACLGVMWTRPAPRDHFYIAMMHGDGTCRLRGRRGATAHAFLAFRHQYKVRREYSWEGVNANYRRASRERTGERDRYRAVAADKRN